MKPFKIKMDGALPALTAFRVTRDEVAAIEAPSTPGQLRINSTGARFLGVNYTALKEGGQYVEVASLGDVVLDGVTYENAHCVYLTELGAGAKLASPSGNLGGPVVFSSMSVYSALKGKSGKNEEGQITTAVWNFVLTPIVGVSEEGPLSLEAAEDMGLIKAGSWMRDYEPTGNIAGEEVAKAFLLSFNGHEVKDGRNEVADAGEAEAAAPKKAAKPTLVTSFD